MECPRCSFEQPPTHECVSCGIVFAKYYAQKQRADNEVAAADDGATGQAGWSDWAGPRETAASSSWHESDSALIQPDATPAPQAAAAWTPGQGEGSQMLPAAPRAARARVRQGDRLERAIGKPVAGLRFFFAVLCAGMVVFLLVSGKGLTSWVEYAMTAFFAGAALWGISSAFGKVTVRQFMSEALVLGVATAGFVAVQILIPDGTFGERPVSRVVKPAAPHTPSDLERFNARALAYMDAATRLLDIRGRRGYDVWDDLDKKLQFDDLLQLHSKLSNLNQSRASRVWKGLQDVQRQLREALEQHKKPAGDGYSFELADVRRVRLNKRVSEVAQAAANLKVVLGVN